MTTADQYYRALGRLYNYRRMLELNAPLPILAPAKEKMIATKEALGSDWSVVEAAYHEYAEGRKEDDGVNRTWEKRCVGCVHWKGHPWEWQDESLDIQEVKWCEQYKLDEIHRPDECPDFSEKGDQIDDK